MELGQAAGLVSARRALDLSAAADPALHDLRLMPHVPRVRLARLLRLYADTVPSLVNGEHIGSFSPRTDLRPLALPEHC